MLRISKSNWSAFVAFILSIGFLFIFIPLVLQAQGEVPIVPFTCRSADGSTFTSGNVEVFEAEVPAYSCNVVDFSQPGVFWSLSEQTDAGLAVIGNELPLDGGPVFELNFQGLENKNLVLCLSGEGFAGTCANVIFRNIPLIELEYRIVAEDSTVPAGSSLFVSATLSNEGFNIGVSTDADNTAANTNAICNHGGTKGDKDSYMNGALLLGESGNVSTACVYTRTSEYVHNLRGAQAEVVFDVKKLIGVLPGDSVGVKFALGGDTFDIPLTGVGLFTSDSFDLKNVADILLKKGDLEFYVIGPEGLSYRNDIAVVANDETALNIVDVVPPFMNFGEAALQDGERVFFVGIKNVGNIKVGGSTFDTTVSQGYLSSGFLDVTELGGASVTSNANGTFVMTPKIPASAVDSASPRDTISEYFLVATDKALNASLAKINVLVDVTGPIPTIINAPGQVVFGAREPQIIAFVASDNGAQNLAAGVAEVTMNLKKRTSGDVKCDGISLFSTVADASCFESILEKRQRFSGHKRKIEGEFVLDVSNFFRW